MNTEKPFRLKLYDAEKNETMVYHKKFTTAKEAEAYVLKPGLGAEFDGWEVDIIKLIKEVA